MNNSILKNASLNAGLTLLYVVLITTFMSYMQKIFGENTPDPFLIPTAMLLLFVASASITGFLVLGRPIMWYLDGKKKEAVYLLGTTIACLFVLVVMLFIVMIVFK